MVEILSILAQWTSLAWVAEQATQGNILPFATWTAIVAVAGFAVGAKYESIKQGRVSKRKIARGFSNEVKAAAKAAIEADGPIPLGKYWESVIAFARKHQDVFCFCYEIDDVGDADTFQLSPIWRVYLNRHKHYLE